MRILSTNVYVGPNLYASFPVIRHTVDLGVLEDYPTGRLPGFGEALLAALPGLREHGCCYGEEGGFVRRLSEGEGTWMGHVWEHAALELQRVAGSEVSFGKTRSTGRARGEYDMIYEYEHAELGLMAGALALRLILQLLPFEVRLRCDPGPDPICDWDGECETFVRSAQRFCFGPSTRALVAAAEARGIPWIRLNRGSLLQLGHGHHQKRIMATVTSETRLIAAEIASDKRDTRDLLASLGLPVPRQELVYCPEAAAEAAESIGYPVVVKPRDANQGRGVSIRLEDRSQIRTAFDLAYGHGTSLGVLVESFVPGCDYRLLIVNGEFVAGARRIPGHVVGDGRHTIRELVEIVNQDPRRGLDHERVLTRLSLDGQAEWLLGRAGLGPDSTLAAGRRFELRSTANLSTGGTAVDVTDLVHPDNREIAVRAVRAVGLDIAGVDFLCEDITRPHTEVGGAIVEINASPGLRMHLAPSEGRPRRVAEPVIEMLYPRGTPHRIPIAAVTGTNGKTTTTRMVSHILRSAGYHPGDTTTDGVSIGGKRVTEGDMTGPTGAGMVLGSPEVDAAVLEVARGGLLRAGLGFDRCDVAACLNVSSDHLGFGGIDTLDELAEIKGILVETAQGTAVLNADDPRVARMADRAVARELCYLTMDPKWSRVPRVREHIQGGGLAVVLESDREGEEWIVLFDDGRRVSLLETGLVPATLQGKARHNVQNAMFAAGIAYALGRDPAPLTVEQIRHGLRTFTPTFKQSPGRMNLFDGHPFRVILDYAHNPAAAEAMCVLADGLDVSGQRILVFSVPDNRRDEDYRDIARTVARNFGRFICTQDEVRRGRADGETPALLKRFLLEAGLPEAAVEVVLDQGDAITRGLQVAMPGDLVLIFAESSVSNWERITGFHPVERNGAKVARSIELEPTPRIHSLPLTGPFRE